MQEFIDAGSTRVRPWWCGGGFIGLEVAENLARAGAWT